MNRQRFGRRPHGKSIAAQFVLLTALPAYLLGIGFADAARVADQPLGLEEPRLSAESGVARRIQKALSDIGFYHGGIDGRMSRQLESAIRRYQKRTGRRVDGKATEELANHLETQNRVGTMLRRLDKTRAESRRAARRALVGRSETRDFIALGTLNEVADPTRDTSGCFQHPSEACLLAEAVESAKAIGKAELRDWALGEILVSQAKSGFVTEAISTVRRIGDERLIIVALRDIARAQASSGRVSGAQAAAAIIPDPFKRLEALAAIADIQMKRNDEAGARKTAAAVVAAARKLPTPLQQVTLLAQMAIVLNKIGSTEGARLLLRDAHLIARSSDLSKRVRRVERGAALRHVASAYSEIGQPVRALAVIRDVPGEHDRTAVLMSAATAQATNGDSDAALKTAEQINSPRYKSVTLGRIAISQAKEGAHVIATETITAALKAAEGIKTPFARSYAVGQLALALVEIGTETGNGALAQAVTTAKNIENERLKAYALWMAAAAQERRGPAEDAKETRKLAIAATKNIKSALSRVWMFGDIASESAERGARAPMTH